MKMKMKIMTNSTNKQLFSNSMYFLVTSILSVILILVYILFTIKSNYNSVLIIYLFVSLIFYMMIKDYNIAKLFSINEKILRDYQGTLILASKSLNLSKELMDKSRGVKK